jgi:hypothetical protein
VCDAPGVAGVVLSGLSLLHGRGKIGDGTGLSRSSPSRSPSVRVEPGASVGIVREPGKNHTSTSIEPVFMIENIRTSKYDRCSDTFPRGGQTTRD